MCFQCGDVSVFRKDLTLRLPTPKEAIRIAMSPCVIEARAMRQKIMQSHMIAVAVISPINAPLHGLN